MINILFDEFVNEFFPEDGQNEFDIENFVFEHIFKNLFFVVIETKASLSKTLEIFDTINTTGLDLKGTDVFKIRFFEYLKDRKNQPDEIFNEINNLYAKIDKINENGTITNMEQILSIYQVFLIGKYKLSNQLYTLNVNTFFDRLFDAILNNITKDLNFNLPKDFDLEIKEIDEIIDSRLEFYYKLENFSSKLRCEYHLILNSRYGRYWIWIILFNLKYEGDNLEEFVSKLSKVLSIYSIKFAKTVNWVHSKMRELNLKIQKGNSFIEIDNWFNENFFTVEQQNKFKEELEKPIAHNWKWKYIICCTSAMLEEENNADLFSWLFKESIDIEHIQSVKDKNEKERVNIINEWGNELNSIGNLMILEQRINRSIHNEDYSVKISSERANDKPTYQKSKFKIVHNQISKYPGPEWSLKMAKERKESEKKKLIDYLFGKT